MTDGIGTVMLLCSGIRGGKGIEMTPELHIVLCIAYARGTRQEQKKIGITSSHHSRAGMFQAKFGFRQVQVYGLAGIWVHSKEFISLNMLRSPPNMSLRSNRCRCIVGTEVYSWLADTARAFFD